jgi:3D (Asp-Asp-Asp) domain-containing protein
VSRILKEKKKGSKQIMKVLARWSFIFIAALSVSSYGIQPQVEETSILANNSHIDNQKIQPINNFLSEESDLLENLDEFQTNTNQTDDSKLVKKTGMVERKSAARGFRATAYCLKGRTAMGGSVRRGIVAADPRILPLGSRVYLNAGPYSGVYTVADTGGAIKGNILDIWVPSCSEANRFGRRTITVTKSN